MFNRFNPELLADRAREVYGESRDMARRGAHEANSFIHSRPMAATLLALGAGVLMGMIYPRKKAAPVLRRGRRAVAATITRKRTKV